MLILCRQHHYSKRTMCTCTAQSIISFLTAIIACLGCVLVFMSRCDREGHWNTYLLILYCILIILSLIFIGSDVKSPDTCSFIVKTTLGILCLTIVGFSMIPRGNCNIYLSPLFFVLFIAWVLIICRSVDHILNIICCISEEQNDISEEFAMTDQPTARNEIEII